VKEGAPIVSLEQSLHSKNEEIYPLRAPFEGDVVQILHNEGEYVDVGKDNSPLVRIDDTTKLFITASIPETDIEKVKRGQKVVIKASAVFGKEYHGVITQIFGAATEKSNGASHPGDRVEFQIRIAIEDKDERLRPGMSTIVDVITEKRHGVLALPHEFIEKENDGYFITLVDGKRKSIKVGMQNDRMFEIQDGANEGDKVRMVDFAALPQPG
jgi:RND family efflux transporter MFP subunit